MYIATDSSSHDDSSHTSPHHFLEISLAICERPYNDRELCCSTVNVIREQLNGVGEQCLQYR